MIIQEPIQAAIWHCLNHYAFEDAVFLSERLYAEVESDESLYLLATSYYRSGLKNNAYAVLKQQQNLSPQCKYLYACCALDLEEFKRSEIALCGTDVTQRNFDDLVTEFGDQASFVLQLLGRICAKTERNQRASEAYRKSLKINPFLWSSFTQLCNKGETPDASQIFQLNNLETLSACTNDSLPRLQNVFNQSMITNNYTPSPTPLLQSTVNTSKLCTPELMVCNPLLLSGLGALPITRVKPARKFFPQPENQISIPIPIPIPIQPSFGVLRFDESPDTYTTESNDQQSLAKRVRAHVGQLINRKESPLQINKPVFSQSGNVNSTPSQTTTPTKVTANVNVRRSSRLFSNSYYSVKENNKSPNRNKFSTAKSPTRKSNKRLVKSNLTKNLYNRDKIPETITSPENNNNNVNNNATNLQQHTLTVQKQCAEGLMQLMSTLGQAYLCLAHYECRKAIEFFSNVSRKQAATSWVQSLLGICYFELGEYDRAVEYFSFVHKRESFRLEYMEMYSTALWHLQKEVELSALAQDLMELDKSSPITWCVVGNCFSLQKEHDTAIKFFQRAVQVDPTFPYAYTLLGHEYITTEELDKAMSSFRNAIRLDSRHYNAWFGIGTIYCKQERYQQAEFNYLKALSINKHSSILLCHIGVVQQALKKVDKALQTLNAAIATDPSNPLCKFHRGQVYFNMGRHAEALKELEELKQIVPKESLVYYLIGKVHKKLGNTDLALMHFSWATDLDPKGASSQIKEAFDPSLGRTYEGSPTVDDLSGGESSRNLDRVRQQLVFDDLAEESDDSL